VTDDQPSPAPDPDATDTPTGNPTANFLAALEVRRNAGIGFGIGVVFAAVVFALFGRGSRYLILAVIVALAGGALLAFVLTLVTAWRRIRALDE
jgi:hypothetical protein